MIWSGEIYYYQNEKNNFHFHHNLEKTVKNKKNLEQGSIFQSFFVKSIFSLWFISFLPFMGLGSRESIQESSYGVIFLFFFIKELLETFISDTGAGLRVGVGLGFQYADIEVTDFLWFERKSSSSNIVAPKCLHPWSAPPLHIQNAEYTHSVESRTNQSL